MKNKNMPITTEHYRIIKQHFHFILGGKCVNCESINDLHIHHKNGTHLSNGEKGCGGRGSFNRMYDWFEEFKKGNLELVCKQCHLECEKYHGS